MKRPEHLRYRGAPVWAPWVEKGGHLGQPLQDAKPSPLGLSVSAVVTPTLRLDELNYGGHHLPVCWLPELGDRSEDDPFACREEFRWAGVTRPCRVPCSKLPSPSSTARRSA